VSVVEIDGLRKEYGDVTALDGLSLSVESGSVYGFLGPNGAGKSTTINVMLDFAKPTAGAARLFGMDAQKRSTAIRRRTGCLLEGYGAYPRLTGREHVEHAVATKDADDDPDELLSRVDLLEDAGRRAGTYSKGMRQRMAIAVALVGEPDLLVLDEPSTGLDPNGARTLRNIVRAEADRGATVFFSSHVLEDVQAVADEVGILLGGDLVAEGGLDELRRELGAGSTLTVEVERVPDDLPGRLRGIDGVREVEADASALRVTTGGDGDAKLAALNAVADAGVYRDFDLEDVSLSDVFSEYTEGDGEAGTVSPGARPAGEPAADAPGEPAADTAGGDR
jgi:ABC-2 type transport system ATP-binding protein